MKKLYAQIIFIVSAMHMCLGAKIVDSYAITDIIKYLDPTIAPKDTLIVYDLDNTLIESVNEMGSPQQFSALLRKRMALYGITKEEAIEQTLPLYTLIAQYTPIRPIEDTTVNLINLLQDAGYKSVVLTARTGNNLAATTCKQLSDLHIDFTKSAVTKKSIKDPSFVYQCNIIFADGGNKGELLLKFLKATKFKPKLIIFVDDKDYNVHAVEGSLQQKGMNHVSIQYRFCDEKAHAFDLAATEPLLLSLVNQYPDVKKAYEHYVTNSTNSMKQTHKSEHTKVPKRENPNNNQPSHN